MAKTPARCWCDDNREDFCNRECRVIAERDRYHQALVTISNGRAADEPFPEVAARALNQKEVR